MKHTSSGEITLQYECDTDRFHRYRGHKSGKEVTVYVEKLRDGRIPVGQFKAIISIDEHEPHELPKNPLGLVSRNCYEREQRFEKDRLDAIKFRSQQLELLQTIVSVTRDNNRILAEININANTRIQNNNRHPVQKRSKR